VILAIPLAVAALWATACGTQGVQVPEDDPTFDGAVLFAERCSGCHTLAAAGAEGSGNRALRIQGPNFDQRKEDYRSALFAIRNGGYSGAIMPQNIVVGEQAEQVASFVATWSGKAADSPPTPAK
jgi:mono/diheme cytochrome c family protein